MKTHHMSRSTDGKFITKSYWCSPMLFVTENIPNGVPFKIYRGSISDNNDVTEDFKSLQQNGEFFIVESAGGGGGLLGKIIDPLGIFKIFQPKQSTPNTDLANTQGASANNSLTDRNNKPRPYERSYDICGTVQSIPNNLMATYQKYDSSGSVIEYGFYDVGRGPLNTPADGITDGDTLVSEITGSSAYIYPPFNSPNSGTAQTAIGDPITEGLFITAESNEIDGATLKAPNDLAAYVGSTCTASLSGVIGTIADPSGDAEFNEFLAVGDVCKFTNVSVDLPGDNTNAFLDGYYTVTSISSVDIKVNVSSNLSEWQKLGATTWNLEDRDKATIGPQDVYTKSLTDWVTIRRIKSERVMANISAVNGMYKDDGGSSKKRASVIAELQYQLIGDDGVPYGPVYAQQGEVSGRSADATGTSIVAVLPSPSAFRARMRRVTDLDLDFNGTVVDEIKYDALYGQSQDFTPHYGNRTTIHTARRQTPRATAIKQPQIKVLATEMLYKYLGGGIFDTVLTANTKAAQSLIRLLRDPVCGGLTLTNANMDALLATQQEIESYFNSELAGQFCYTFDDYKTTMQDIINTISEAIFCRNFRKGHAVLLDFERPRIGPEMVFTHRSKTASEKWTRSFNDDSAYDSLKFSYIDPDTNIKETIAIPEDGGKNTETYDSKGIRNYDQAYWHAWRRYQKNSLRRVLVDFSATEEGVFAIPGRAISVVKGSRVAPQDGYVIAVNGLTLTLSQPVTFIPGDDHSVILKKRDGTVQSVAVDPGNSPREVVMRSVPAEAPYTGNSALKTEFSFGSEQRHKAQMMLVDTVVPNDDRTVKITGFNYDPNYYLRDGVSPFGRAFSNGFNNGFS